MSDLAIFHEGAPEPCAPDFNLVAYVLRHAKTTPDKTALIEIAPDLTTRNISYGALEQMVLGSAAGLRARGLRAGDKLVLRLGNSLNFPIAFLASIAIGAIPVPTAAGLSAPELDKALAILGEVKALICDEALVPQNSQIPIIPAQELAAQNQVAMQEHPPHSIAPSAPDDPAYIIFTSGSSGTPKAVIHAHRAVWARRMMWRDWYGLGARDRLLHAGALNWTYTLGTGLMDPWAAGATALVYTGTGDRSLWPQMIRDHGVTLFAAAPGVFRQIVDAGQVPPMPALRHGLSAGEALPQRVARAWQEATGAPILTALGMSECSTYVSMRPDGTQAPLPQRGRHIAILHEDGTIAPRGETGDLAVHRADQGLMLGYLQGGAPKLPLRGDWFITGDLAQMDAQGAISHQGRADDLITAGGFRVAPLEIERALQSYAGITDCAAAPIQTKRDATIIAAFYEAASAIDETALHSYMSAKLARYKQPRAYIHLPQLPRRANGKLDRKALASWTKL